MDLGRLNYEAAALLFDEFARCGVRHVCISPGGRSTPLAAALARSSLRPWVITDERAAAFFALGLAQAGGAPVVLVCTSGTAVANYAPAIAEAAFAEVPLLVLTADRPAELRDCGAAQTIRQDGIFGQHCKWSHEAATPADGVDLHDYWRSLACRAHARASEGPAGPVHLNLPFREPLVAEDPAPSLPPGRADGQPWVRIRTGTHRASGGDVEALADILRHRRGCIVAGPRTSAASVDAIARLADHLGWPILADPLSGLRHGTHAGADWIIDSYDVFLRDAGCAESFAPEVVLRFGALPTSKALQRWLAATPATQVLAGASHSWGDPSFRVAEVVYGDAGVLCDDLRRNLPAHATTGGWASAWIERARETRRAIDDLLLDVKGTVPLTGLSPSLCRGETLFEGAIAVHLLRAMPEGAALVVGSSMPVRDIDTFGGAQPRALRLFSNRGANGIDGVVATALGVAAALDAPTYLLIGDLSFLHDIGALQIAARHRLDLCIVVPNNDGGGIFSYLPQARLTDAFEPFFGTPHGLSLEPAVRMCGGTHVTVDHLDGLDATLRSFDRGSGLRVIELPTDRAYNVERHRRIVSDVAARLQPLREVA